MKEVKRYKSRDQILGIGYFVGYASIVPTKYPIPNTQYPVTGGLR